MKAEAQRYFEIISDTFDFYRFKKFEYWEKLFLYFWFGSLIGQLYEIVAWNHNSATIIPFAPPYGLGLIAVIIFIYPLVKKTLVTKGQAYLITAILMGIVEYACAAAIILVYGKNIYWNYSHRVLNFGGNTCAESAILFGLMATIFLYYIYPITEKLSKLQPKIVTRLLFLATLSFFVFDIIIRGIERLP